MLFVSSAKLRLSIANLTFRPGARNAKSWFLLQCTPLAVTHNGALQRTAEKRRFAPLSVVR